MAVPVGGGKGPVNAQGKSKVDTSGNVRVVCRVRPLAKYEIEKGCQPVVVKVPNLGGTGKDDGNEEEDGGPEVLQINQPEQRWFELDAVLDESSSQRQIYEKCGAQRAIRDDLFAGYNTTILAYGQTGAGKTFTMGTAAKTVANQIDEMDGIIPRAIHDLFDNIQSKCDSNAQVELSYLEVYNEEIRDLMNPNGTTSGENSQLRIRETMTGEVYVRGLQSRSVSNPSEIGKLMEEASGRRVVASTKMNAESSRSHAICVLRIKGVLEDSTKFQSKLTLVDLAGSERIKKTEAKGNRAQEGININKGLFVLGQVVSALAEQRPKFKRKPPFRDSKLTRLLQDSLGGNSRTIMIACCSPADFNLEETVNTLRYATQARNIRNTATANVVQQISQEEAMKLQRENQLLKKEIEELQETIRKLTEDGLTEEDMNRSIAMIHEEQQRSFSMTHVDTMKTIHGMPTVSPLEGPKATVPHNAQHHLPSTPELEVPPSQSSEDEEEDDNEDDSEDEEDSDEDEEEDDEDEDVDSDEGAAMSEAGDEPGPLGSTMSPHGQKRTVGGGGKKQPISLASHFNSQSEINPHQHGPEDETSLQLEDVLPGYRSTDRSVATTGSTKSYQELEDENEVLKYKLRKTQTDMKASMTQSAIELPALKARVQMLEEELNESVMIEAESEQLRRELDEAKADRKSALLAARQLAAFMEKQKSQTGFRGDELEKKRMWYFHKRLDEKWVEFVVTMLGSFKEQMRLLGDYFSMVVTVVESPDILTMLGPSGMKKHQGGGWFGGRFGGGKNHDESHGAEEKELRHRLLGEHIKFFNARLLEIEDEINNRSESVDAILEGLNYEREEMESELEETEFVRDFFSKKGEKLLKHLTELMTGPLYSLGALEGSVATLNSSRQVF